MKDGSVADALERQRFWTELMRSGGESTVNRLKASELLAKIQGDFAGQADYVSSEGGELLFDRLSDEYLASLVAEAASEQKEK